MKLFEEELFPVRFLGFGLFWAWLFMVGLSPSPLFGNPLCLGSVPFELFELLMRCAVLTLSLALSRPIATNRGKRLYLAVGAIAGMAVTPLLLWGEGATAHSLAALLAAVAEVSLFLMWLSFFGAMRLGDTLTLLVMSYGVGALLFLATLIGGQGALVAASIAFPFCRWRLLCSRGGSFPSAGVASFSTATAQLWCRPESRLGRRAQAASSRAFQPLR